MTIIGVYVQYIGHNITSKALYKASYFMTILQFNTIQYNTIHYEYGKVSSVK